MLTGLPSEAAAGGRVALVIGNSAYQNAPPLANPSNDAADMVVVLKAQGFKVVEGHDLDKAAFNRKVQEFATALHGAEAGVFFFAGHGLQGGGSNYLAPVDAQLSSASALDFEMVRLDLIQRVMENEADTNIIFLDACRDNPLARNLARSMGTRSASIGRGLAPVESGVGTLISFSTQPGNVALDGRGRNSPFAGALVRHLGSPGEDLSDILIAVRNDVMKETDGKQVPWEHSAMTGRFYFSGEVVPGTALQLSEAAQAWDRVKDTDDVAVLDAFAARYKESFYSKLATFRRLKLQNKKVAALTPAQPAQRQKPPPPTEPISQKGNNRWVKLCKDIAVTSSSDTGGQSTRTTCITFQEELNADSGEVLVSAAIRHVEGNDKRHLIVRVPLGVAQRPGMRVGIYRQDQWTKAQAGQTIKLSELYTLDLAYAFCDSTACSAETEATDDTIEWMRRGGGLVALALNTAGKQLTYPLALSGFAASYAGAPLDNTTYEKARKKMLQQIKARQAAKADAKD